MSDTLKPDRPESEGDWGWDFEGARRHHLVQGLRMISEEQLRWLEETVEEMRSLQGLARKGRPVSEG